MAPSGEAKSNNNADHRRSMFRDQAEHRSRSSSRESLDFGYLEDLRIAMESDDDMEYSATSRNAPSNLETFLDCLIITVRTDYDFTSSAQTNNNVERQSRNYPIRVVEPSNYINAQQIQPSVRAGEPKIEKNKFNIFIGLDIN
ncbi:unnamed protein product [Caenorhabditis bovis]|uniref:Uncharacterized protein n=1 Tax=Caenorhabditis bovis TaxID=2654633 RepID=A0A8S1F755_9PELO|nr:unnamed protein product [Caenorhabditis bovis]